MKINVKIREYESTDKVQLLEIFKKNIPGSFALSELDDLIEYLDNRIEKYFVAEIENRIVGGGGINFCNENKTGKISWDFIDPAFHGNGIGKELLDYRINIITGIKEIENIKVRTSQLAYGFYQKYGFVIEKTVRDYWAKGFDLYEMIYSKEHIDEFLKNKK